MIRKIFETKTEVLGELLPVVNTNYPFKKEENNEYYFIEEDLFRNSESLDELQFYRLKKIVKGSEIIYSLRYPISKVKKTAGLFSGVMGN